MKVNLEFVAVAHLSCQDLVKEVIYAQVVVLFVDHIKANDHLGVLVGLDHSIDGTLDVALTEHFESTDDDADLEQWESLFDPFLYRLEDFKLLA